MNSAFPYQVLIISVSLSVKHQKWFIAPMQFCGKSVAVYMALFHAVNSGRRTELATNDKQKLRTIGVSQDA